MGRKQGDNMKDLWFKKECADDVFSWVVYESEEDAMEYIGEDDELYKIPAEHIQYLGTMKLKLEK